MFYRYYNLYAKDFMRKGLEYVSYETTYRDLRHLLRNSKHASYPLVDHQGKSVVVSRYFLLCCPTITQHIVQYNLKSVLPGIKQ